MQFFYNGGPYKQLRPHAIVKSRPKSTIYYSGTELEFYTWARLIFPNVGTVGEIFEIRGKGTILKEVIDCIYLN